LFKNIGEMLAFQKGDFLASFLPVLKELALALCTLQQKYKPQYVLGWPYSASCPAEQEKSCGGGRICTVMEV
jgi:hypothetical protein